MKQPKKEEKSKEQRHKNDPKRNKTWIVVGIILIVALVFYFIKK